MNPEVTTYAATINGQADIKGIITTQNGKANSPSVTPPEIQSDTKPIIEAEMSCINQNEIDQVEISRETTNQNEITQDESSKETTNQNEITRDESSRETTMQNVSQLLDCSLVDNKDTQSLCSVATSTTENYSLPQSVKKTYKRGKKKGKTWTSMKRRNNNKNQKNKRNIDSSVTSENGLTSDSCSISTGSVISETVKGNTNNGAKRKRPKEPSRFVQYIPEHEFVVKDYFNVTKVVERKNYFECICGTQKRVMKKRERHVIQCTECGLWQHAECVHYDTEDPYRGVYKCPHCSVISVSM